MLTMVPRRFTEFENAVIKMNLINVRFGLAMSLLNEGPCDYDVICCLLDDLLEEYRRLQMEFSSIFDSLESVKVLGSAKR